MARSPEMAAAKDAVATAEAAKPAASETPKYLRGPDGYVYIYTPLLAKQPGFFPYHGKTDKRGFAVDQ